MRRRTNHRVRRVERFLSRYPPEPLPLPAAYYTGGEYPAFIRISFTDGHTATYRMGDYQTPWHPRWMRNEIIGYQYRGGGVDGI